VKVVVVSTYPREGTKNVGDKLIEASTVGAIRAADPNAEITVVPREDGWDDIRDRVRAADHVVFACLAIRPQMDTIYPALDGILASGVPVSALATGTRLNPVSNDIFARGFSDRDIALLRALASAAQVFTTRGVLSQAFCDFHGLEGAVCTGDIAFVDPRFDARVFRPLAEVRRVIVSDPHYAGDYARAYARLVSQLRRLFPGAELACALHGENPEIETRSAKLDVRVLPVYRSPDDGLDVYDEFDLHVGFRVHGHVSALKRRKPSYLLEQDGRGTDYGLTLDRRISVACYRTERVAGGRVQQAVRALRGAQLTQSQVPLSGVDALAAMIVHDAGTDFAKFVGLEASLADFARRNLAAVSNIVRGAGPVG
jgi:hypothetical protein